MDILSTTIPRSDQQNFDDYSVAPRTVTVAEVKRGSAEQPVEVHLVEFPGRPFKPSKSMRRVLIACWGSEASAYKGRRMTLFGDPTVKFGGIAVGGIRIAALSNIGEPKTILITETRSKRKEFVVRPLADDIGEHLAALTGATTLEGLQGVWQKVAAAGFSKLPQLIELKDARKRQLTPAPELSDEERAIADHFEATPETALIAERGGVNGGQDVSGVDEADPDYVEPPTRVSDESAVAS